MSSSGRHLIGGRYLQPRLYPILSIQENQPPMTRYLVGMNQFKPGSETNSKAIASIKTEDFTCKPKDRACGMIEKQGSLKRSSHLILTLSIKIDKACSYPGV
jgi:hypothetical protein